MSYNAYTARNEVLLSLGFKSYKEYLSSSLWHQIRSSCLHKHPKCRICKKARATQVHHYDYHRNTLLGLWTSRLYAICAACHREAEFNELGQKVSLAKANARNFVHIKPNKGICIMCKSGPYKRSGKCARLKMCRSCMRGGYRLQMVKGKIAFAKISDAEIEKAWAD